MGIIKKTDSNSVPNWGLRDYNEFWGRFVKVNKVNKPSQKFAHSFTINGVSAHIRMIRRRRAEECIQSSNVNTKTKTGPSKKSKKATANENVPSTPKAHPHIQAAYDRGKIDCLIGNDPGEKVPVSVTRHDLKTHEEYKFKISAKQWHARTGYYKRRHKLNQYTGEFERMSRELRENREKFPEQPSPKSHDFATYLEYKLEVFNTSCDVSIFVIQIFFKILTFFFLNNFIRRIIKEELHVNASTNTPRNESHSIV